MTYQLDQRILDDWLRDYFKREFLRLSVPQFKCFVELRGFPQSEQNYLTRQYERSLHENHNNHSKR